MLHGAASDVRQRGRAHRKMTPTVRILLEERSYMKSIVLACRLRVGTICMPLGNPTHVKHHGHETWNVLAR